MADRNQEYLESFLRNYLGINVNDDPQDKIVVFCICGFLFLITAWKLLFWKQSPVVYEAVTLLSGYGIGRLIRHIDAHKYFETAGDIISVNVLYSIMPIYVYTATMDLHSAFGSSANMFGILIFLIPIFIVNWFFISWVLYLVFGPALESSTFEMLIITLIMSPIQVQYILDTLDLAQGRLAEVKFKIRVECFSSLYLSFLISEISYSYYHQFVNGELSVTILVLFVFYQAAIGILLGCVTAKIVQIPVQMAAKHPPLCVAISFASVFFVTSWCIVLGTSTVLAVGFFGMTSSAVIIRYCLPSVEFYRQAWSFFLLLASSFTVGLTGLIIGYTDQPKGISLFRVTLVFYCIFLMTRLVLFMIFYPLVTQMIGLKMEWRYLAIQVVGLYKGGPNYIMALLYAVMQHRNWYNVLLVVATYNLLSSVFNVLLFPLLLKIMGMFDYSASRIANMNVALSHTNNCREKAIFALKMDKVVVDANWQVVEDVTQLSHPYKRFMNDSNFLEDIRDDRQIRSVVCPDCKTEILAQPTKREIDSMKKEARERIIKSQQVSFHRQYEHGALTTAEYDFLSSLVETEMGATEPRLRPEKLKSRGVWVKTIIQIKRFLIWFRELTEETYSFVPINTIRFWCFQISISRTWRIMFALFVLLDTALSIAQVMIYWFGVSYVDDKGIYVYVGTHYYFALYAQYVHMVLHGLSILECVMSLSGLGFNQYFSRNVNKIEFACGIVLGTVMVVVIIRDSVELGQFIHPFNYDIIMLINVFMWLRVVKLYILIIAIVPRVIHKVDKLLTDEMMRNYEVGKAYLVALNRTATLLNRIVYSEDVYNVLMKEIDEDRMYISKELGLIQNENPSIATTIKTRHAIRFVINSMEDCIKDMREEGVVDMIEAEAIAESLEKNRLSLRKFALISATPPEDILKNIPWLKDDSESLQYLLENAQLFSHDYGDVLFRAGEDPMGIHLVVSGLLKSQYVPSTTTLQLSAKFGVLPNYDFFENMKFDQPQEAFVVSGSIIGEIGAVSGRRYDMTITCETAAQVYHIPFSIVKKVIHEADDSLKMQARIWKTICVKIALNILQYNVVSFQSWAPEKLLIYLSKGFVPIIPDMVGFTNSTRVEVIVLIEGILMDKVTRKVYTGPCYIPKNTHELILPDHPDWDFQTICETRMLIIPSNITNEEELKGPNGMFKYKVQKKEEEGHRKVGFQEDESVIGTTKAQ